MKGIIIPENIYEPTTKVRNEVVQQICDRLIESLDTCDTHVLIRGEHPSLYLKEFHGKPIIADSVNYTIGGCTRITTCEMKTAFEIIQDAGYFIYEKDSEYQISLKPYLWKTKAKRVTFDFFID